MLHGCRDTDNTKPDGIINNDGGSRATYFGIWQQSWTKDSYMWKIGDTIYLSSMVTTKPMGSRRFAIIEHLHGLRYNVVIPNPSIFDWPEDPSKLGFIVYKVRTYTGDVVVWKKPAKS
jgi:hypothetical protein